MKHSGPDDWRNGGFGLYVHWPFCAAKCPYCDFNSHVAKEITHDAWREAYVAEIARWAERTPGRVLTSIFFGGGTPSLMEPETVAAVIDAAKTAWTPANDLEITLEANPTSVEMGRFQGFADAGVNRVSLGVQALDDEALRLLGRRHSVAEAMAAWDVANTVFSRTSLDLIYARQFQEQEAWRRELTTALSLKPTHLSLYQLTIEDGTAFGDRWANGKLPGLPSEDRGADLWDITQDMCGSAGLMAYEVSNHAVAGEESRHNQVYWRYGDYVGIGPGAHGRISSPRGRSATVAERAPIGWLSSIQKRSPAVDESAIEPEEQAMEYLMMGMRLSEGIDLERFAQMKGRPLEETAVVQLEELGLVTRKDGRLAVTASGRPVLNSVLRALF
ncbi:radical SAM family heme chaperone HemW [Pararhodobacter zhoushanensis]|uniref:Heme chaperone HemW n=1 Tax=Pararhodobacter zhoushanensis TaxID=2479545 RepID=A0ABT3GUN4_9RHOB|nr:radical SAM family heme chaperone HemW [Pararhodobacter zhoushanensis]MCW1931242.1 radical SAM family heme chaperone HemW [Pararhodobacter zhoushanensis]